MGFAPTWLRPASPLLHMTTLTTGRKEATPRRKSIEDTRDNNSTRASVARVWRYRNLIITLLHYITRNSG